MDWPLLFVSTSPGGPDRRWARPGTRESAAILALLAFAPALPAACAPHDRQAPSGRPSREQPAAPLPDVHFVPTPMNVVDEMLAVAQVGPGDVVYDLGSGDGRIVIAAAKRHRARGVGIDIDAQRISESRYNADTAGVEEWVEFRQTDLFRTDLRDATVVTLYLLRELNIRLRPKLLDELRPGARVVSHAFDMGSWRPDSALVVGTKTVYYWIIPARVAGSWTLAADLDGAERRYHLRLEQEFQQLIGTAGLGRRTLPVADGRLRGQRVTFALADGPSAWLRFEGRVEGGEMSGTVSRIGGPQLGTWRASWEDRR